MKILAIRHGQSMGNVDKDVYRTTKDHNVALTVEGEQQAIACGRTLRNLLAGKDFAIISSPYARTIETTNAIMSGIGTRLDFTTEPLIREQEWKIVRDDSFVYDDFIKEMDDFGKFYFRQRNAESMADVYQRAMVFINNLRLEKHKLPSTLVVVSHSIFISCLIGALKKLDISQIEAIRLENCEIVELDLDHNPYKTNLLRKAS